MSLFTPWRATQLAASVTAGDQSAPDLVALSDGRFALVYVDASVTTAGGGSDSSGSAIRVEIFNTDGSTTTGPIQVNTATTGDQSAPVIVASTAGGFAVAWVDASGGADTGGDDGSGLAVRAQLFDGQGVRIGGEVLAHRLTTGDQSQPSLTALHNGQIAVSFTDASSTGGDTSGLATRLSLINPDGSLGATDLLVNSVTTGDQLEGQLARLTSGQMVAIYTDRSASGSDTSGAALRGQLLDPFGAAQGAPFLVNTTTLLDQSAASVTALTGGGFVVAFQDSSASGGDTSGTAVRLQVFGASGEALGDESLVNEITSGDQGLPEILALSDGRFVVVYEDNSGGVQSGGDDASSTALRAQVFRPNGAASGESFLVNSEVTTGAQTDVTLDELPDGRVVIAWADGSLGADSGGDDTDGALRVQFFDLRARPITWNGTGEGDQAAGTMGADWMRGRGGDDRLVGAHGIDRIAGGAGADTLIGNLGHDLIRGGTGDDVVEGNRGQDRLFGNLGLDVLMGGRGDDMLDGAGGGDRLIGGAGRDSLRGGAGIDSFVFQAASDSARGQDTRDVIVDFKQGADVIDLAAIDEFTFIGQAAFTGTAGELRFHYRGQATVIAADLDGDGRADMQVEVTGRHALETTDFLL